MMAPAVVEGCPGANGRVKRAQPCLRSRFRHFQRRWHNPIFFCTNNKTASLPFLPTPMADHPEYPSSHRGASQGSIGWSSPAAQLDFLLSYLPVFFFQTDSQGRFVELRGSLLADLGIDAQAWLGQAYRNVCTAHPAVHDGIERGLQGEVFQQRWQADDGRQLQGAVLPMLGAGGKVETLMGVAWAAGPGLPLGQSAQHQSQLLKYFIRHAPAAVAMFDREMRYLMFSDEWVHSYGIEADILGKSHYEVFPEIPPRWHKVHQRCLQGVVESCEADPFPRLDGRIDYVDWVVAPWYTEEGEVGGLIFYTRLVNDKVEDQQQLLALNDQLARSLQRLEDLALAVSHTLREPLRQSIERGQRVLYQLKQQATVPLQAEAQGWLNHLYRLEGIVAGLLDNALREDRALTRAVDLNQVMGEVVTNLQPLLDQRQTHLVYGQLPSVQANEFEMVALFQQLIANAVEYNDADAVEVLISSEREEGNWLIEVRDNGVGLNQQQLGQLFSFARQLDVSRPRRPGVGLPVCKRIVERMKGRMWVESTIGQGTVFFFTLPPASPPEQT